MKVGCERQRRENGGGKEREKEKNKPEVGIVVRFAMSKIFLMLYLSLANRLCGLLKHRLTKNGLYMHFPD